MTGCRFEYALAYREHKGLAQWPWINARLASLRTTSSGSVLDILSLKEACTKQILLNSKELRIGDFVGNLVPMYFFAGVWLLALV